MSREALIVEGGVVLVSADGAPREAAAVLVVDGLVAEVGDVDRLVAAHPGVERLGGPGSLVMPGLVNAHQHGEGVSTAQLGFVDAPFEPWMAGMHALMALDPYVTTLAKSLQMLTSGVTTHVHVHFPAKSGYDAQATAYRDDLDATLRAHREAGLRVTFAPYWRDRSTFVYDDDERFLAALPADLAASARRRFGGRDVPNAVYLDAVRTLHADLAADPLIDVQLALAAPQWASDELLDAVAAEARRLDVGIHLHALESRRQRAWGDLVHGGRELHRLAERGVLGPRTTIAHGVHLRDVDIDLLAKQGACVAHNASSNLRLACGIAPVRRLAARGVTVGLGTDDMALGDDDDMLSEVRTAHVIQRVWEGSEPILTARALLGMAWTAERASPGRRAASAAWTPGATATWSCSTSTRSAAGTGARPCRHTTSW